MKNLHKIVISTLLSCSLILLTSCQHTIQGFGQDMEKSGQEIQKSVN